MNVFRLKSSCHTLTTRPRIDRMTVIRPIPVTRTIPSGLPQCHAYGTGTGYPYPSHSRNLYGRTRIWVRWASLLKYKATESMRLLRLEAKSKEKKYTINPKMAMAGKCTALAGKCTAWQVKLAWEPSSIDR